MVDPGLGRTKPGARLAIGTGGRLDNPPSPSGATQSLSLKT